MPNNSILETDDIKRGIKRRYCPFKMLPAIKAILHTSMTSKGRGGGGGTTNKPSKNRVKDDKHNDVDLKCPHTVFNLVIQKQGIHLKNVPNPMFNAKDEECTKYVFTGLCKVPDCSRKASHTPPQGQRKLDCMKFRSECLARYNVAKGPFDPDFC